MSAHINAQVDHIFWGPGPLVPKINVVSLGGVKLTNIPNPELSKFKTENNF